MEEFNTTKDFDLPLMSNIEDIHISHYMLDLACCMDVKQFTGRVILTCESRKCTCGVRSNHKLHESGISQKGSPSNEAQTQLNESIDQHASSELNVHSESKTIDLRITDLKDKNVGARGCAEDLTMKSDICTAQTIDGTLKLEIDSHMANKEMYELVSEYSNSSSIERIRGNSLVPEKTETDPMNSNCDFKMILDAWNLIIVSVFEITPSSENHGPASSQPALSNNRDQKIVLEENKHTPHKMERKCALMFKSTDKSIEIWKPNLKCPCLFPQTIEICYNTKPIGPSLKWTLDQDEK